MPHFRLARFERVRSRQADQPWKCGPTEEDYRWLLPIRGLWRFQPRESRFPALNLILIFPRFVQLNFPPAQEVTLL